RFTDSSTDPDGSVAKWSWNFGDGTTSADRNPRHTYTNPGSYTVMLTVEDENGLKGTYYKEIIVEPMNYPPTADFTFLPKEPKAGEEISFADKSYDRDGNIVSWSWDFGDGSTSSEAEPVHVYTSAGNYTVTLTVRDNKGGKDVRRFTLMVSKPMETYTATSTTSQTTTTTNTKETQSQSSISTSTSPTTTSLTQTQQTSSSKTPTSTAGTCGVGAFLAFALAPLLLRRRK
ncbi:PKD domain-containing protein, partial [Palaeococcus sp. (in: euryarchaeotes)]